MNTQYYLLLVEACFRVAVYGMMLVALWRRPELVALGVQSLLRHLVMLGKLLLSPVYCDGFLWCVLALFAFQQATLSSEEAYKYVHPTVLYWLKFTIGSFAATATALKAFRSTTYGEAQIGKLTGTGLPTAPPPPTIPTVTQTQPQQPTTEKQT